MRKLATILVIIMFTMIPFAFYYVWFSTKESFEPLGYGISIIFTAIVMMNISLWLIIKIAYKIDIIWWIFWDDEV
jgi:hypothetical protein